MPKIKANNITMNYDEQGSGENPSFSFLTSLPIPPVTPCKWRSMPSTLRASRSISVEHGETDKPEGAYSTELLADDVAAFMQATGIRKAHISGLSLGAAVGMGLAAKHPGKVQSLSLHGGWPKTDTLLKPIVDSWRVVAKALGSVPEMVILSIFPWCFTPELYAAKPDYIESLAAFVRSRPAQPLASFLEQSNAVLSHDVTAQLSRITAATQMTFGRTDQLTVRFADQMHGSIRGSELLMFERCAHAPTYEKVEEFNRKTLEFLQRHSGAGSA